MKKRLEIVIAIVIIILQLAGISGGTDVVQARDRRPRILLDSYKITEGRLTPGGTVEIKFTFKNTSKNVSANNLLITYSGSDNSIYPDEGEANQFFINEIAANSTESVEIKMRVADSTVVYKEDNDSVQTLMSKVQFNIDYLYDQGGASHEAVNDTFIMLPITQECVLGVKSIAVAENAVLDSKTLVSVVCVNEGTTPVSNVVMHINGNILEEQKKVKIGTVSVNSQQAFDCYINLQEQGKQQLEIYFTYEDEKGVKFQTVKKEYTTNVTKNETVVPTDVGNGMEQQGKENTSGDFMLNLSNLCILGSAFIALVFVITVVVKKKRK